MNIQPLHNHPAIYPTLPPRTTPAGIPAPDDPEWRTCWEFVLTHELTASEGSAFWHGAHLAHQAMVARAGELLRGRDADMSWSPDARPGCGHHLADGALVCRNSKPHEPGKGCTYAASSGIHTKASEAVE